MDHVCQEINSLISHCSELVLIIGLLTILSGGQALGILKSLKQIYLIGYMNLLENKRKIFLYAKIVSGVY